MFVQLNCNQQASSSHSFKICFQLTLPLPLTSMDSCCVRQQSFKSSKPTGIQGVLSFPLSQIKFLLNATTGSLQTFFPPKNNLYIFFRLKQCMISLEDLENMDRQKRIKWKRPMSSPVRNSPLSPWLALSALLSLQFRKSDYPTSTLLQFVLFF